MCNLSRTSIFLLNTNRTYTKCLKYPVLTHLTQPTQPNLLNQIWLKKKNHKTHNKKKNPKFLTQKITRSLSLSCPLLPPPLNGLTSHQPILLFLSLSLRQCLCACVVGYVESLGRSSGSRTVLCRRIIATVFDF